MGEDASLTSFDMLLSFICLTYQMMPWSLLMLNSLYIVGIRQVSEAATIKRKPALQLSVPIFNIPLSYGLVGSPAAHSLLWPYILLTLWVLAVTAPRYKLIIR